MLIYARFHHDYALSLSFQLIEQGIQMSKKSVINCWAFTYRLNQLFRLATQAIRPIGAAVSYPHPANLLCSAEFFTNQDF